MQVKAVMLNPTQSLFAILGSTLLLNSPLIAQAQTASSQAEQESTIQDLLEQVNQYEPYESSFDLGGTGVRGKVGDLDSTSIEDVNSLLDLARRYDCLPDDPDYVFVEGQRTGQYRFAAALAACAQQLHIDAVKAGSVGFIAPADRATFQRHVQRFESKLTMLGIAPESFAFLAGTVEPGQNDVSFAVQVDIIPMSGVFFENPAAISNTSNASEINTSESEETSDRTRLALNSTFSGEDRLFTRLATGCLPPAALIPRPAEADNSEAVVLQSLVYQGLEKMLDIDPLLLLLEDAEGNSAFNHNRTQIRNSVLQNTLKK